MQKHNNSEAPQNGKQIKNAKTQRTLWQRSYLYHYYYKKTGRYGFIGKNLFRVIMVLTLFAIGVWLITNYVVDLDQVMTYITNNFSVWVILATLYLSESFIGLAPPDFYIIWAQSLANPYLMVFYLSLASYFGGVTAYIIGTQMYRVPQIQNWVNIKFAEQFKTFKKFGSLLIIISALAPLPFSWVSVVSGVVRYPFKTYLLMGLSRIIRFFIYAYVFFSVL